MSEDKQTKLNQRVAIWHKNFIDQCENSSDESAVLLGENEFHFHAYCIAILLSAVDSETRSSCIEHLTTSFQSIKGVEDDEKI